MSDDVTCADCDAVIRLSRDDRGRLQVTCGCETERMVRVKQALPEGWF